MNCVTVAAGQAAVILLVQWPVARYLLRRFRAAGVAAGGGYHHGVQHRGAGLATFGSAEAHGFYEKLLLDTAAMTALVTVTLQIAYLPTLYAAFNRRETEIGLLNSRAGSPSWGPVARPHPLRAGLGHLDAGHAAGAVRPVGALGVRRHRKPRHLLAADLVPLGRPAGLVGFRAARRAGLGGVYLSLCPRAAPQVPARLCLRSGLMCFDQIARSMGFDVPEQPDSPPVSA